MRTSNYLLVIGLCLAAVMLLTLTGCEHPRHDHRALRCVRAHESANTPDPYTAQNPSSSASGAYQFIDSTWRNVTRLSGMGTEYTRAKHAPPFIQDAVAYWAMVGPGEHRSAWNGTGCFS